MRIVIFLMAVVFSWILPGIGLAQMVKVVFPDDHICKADVKKDELIPFRDAKFLLNTNDQTKVKTLINKYLELNNENIDNFPTLKKLYERELKILIPDAKISTKTLTSHLSDSIGKGTASVSSLSTQQIAIALSDFIIERVKEELVISFIENFRYTMVVKYPEMEILFPETSYMLLQFEIYDIERYLPLLHERFRVDLWNLHLNMPNFLTSTNRPENEKAKVYDLIRFNFELINSLKSGYHPAYVFSKLDNFDWMHEISPEFKWILQFVALFSRNLKDKHCGPWIKITDFNMVFENQNINGIEFGKLFFELVWAKEKHVFADLNFKEIETDKFYINFNDFLSRMLKKLHKLEGIHSRIVTQLNLGKIPSNSDYNSYFSLSFDFIQINAKFFNLEIGKLPFEEIKAVFQIPINISNKDYSTLFLNTYKLLEMSLELGECQFNDILIYGNFMVNAAQAKNEKELTAAIKAAALPARSYRIKYQHKTNVALSSYPGLLLSSEVIEQNGERGINFGVTAPVGIAYSPSLLYREKTATNGKLDWSDFRPRTIYFPVIDIGTVVSYRLTGGNEGLPNFELQNIIAPGVYLIWGFPKNPFALAAGVQYGPQLRDLDQGITSSSYRVGFNLSVDIPIFNLYSSERGFCKKESAGKWGKKLGH